ncbi:MAG: inosine-5-monophosphate dehydrogenase [Alphaproteobacteria bacterium]|nr:MAG: inosine-5-monophosphate dehydrogenase [Alphaproteobacteria bacterium]
MYIKDVMSTEYQWIAPEATICEAARLMKDQDIGFLPIGENDRLIGTVTDRDITLRAVADNLNTSTQVRDIMTPQLMYCYDDQSVDEICQNMAEIKVRRLPVVNRDKRLVGTVSLGDLAQAQTQQSGEALQSITNCDNAVSQAA